MKTHVLTISRRFPATHKRKGDFTHFTDSIEAKTKIHTIRANYEYWKKRIDEVVAGTAILSVRYWSGKPYNSKQITLCDLTKDDGVGIQEMFFLRGEIFDPIIEGDDITGTIDLAKKDGLSLEDFTEWFRKYDLSEPMAIIHFTNFRY